MSADSGACRLESEKLFKETVIIDIMYMNLALYVIKHYNVNVIILEYKVKEQWYLHHVT